MPFFSLHKFYNSAEMSIYKQAYEKKNYYYYVHIFIAKD